MDVNSWFLSLTPERQAILRDDKWMLASAAYDAGLAEGNVAGACQEPLLPAGDNAVDEVDFDDNKPSPPPTLEDYQSLQRQHDELQTQLKLVRDALKKQDAAQVATWLETARVPRTGKAGCLGEFTIVRESAGTCPKCYTDGHSDTCEICHGESDEEGHYDLNITVPWDTCKAIWLAMNQFAAAEIKAGK